MKFLTDFFPVVLFFIAYKSYDMYVAIQVFMAAIAAQLLLLKLTGRPIEKMHWFSLGAVLVLGGISLWYRDPLFLMWKPSIFNWAFAAALLLSEWLMQRGIMRRMLEAVAPFPDFVIRRLTYAWALFLSFLGVLNLYVAYNFSEDTWVDFKLFGLMGLTLVFALGQGFYLARYMPQEDAAETATEE